MATPPRPPERPTQHQTQHQAAHAPAPAKHEDPPKPTKREAKPGQYAYPTLTDAASLYKAGHRIAKQGDPPSKWISMGVLGDATVVHQTPMTPEMVEEIKSGEYYLADGLKDEPPATEPPVLVDVPHAEGVLAHPGPLTCTQGNWQNTPTNKTYQWLKNGAAVAGATSANYSTTADDVGAKFSCTVTAINAAGSAESTSNEVGPVT